MGASIQSKGRAIVGRLSKVSLRDLLAVGLPMALVLAAGFWAAAQFVRPAPPDTLVLATGAEGGAYQRFGAAYKGALAGYGIKVVEAATGGSLDNLRRLRDPTRPADAGFFQGGTGGPEAGDRLVSLGATFYEPLWIFYRADLAPRGGLDQVAQLKGRRVAVGGVGSGTRHLALSVLAANGLDGDNTTLLDQGGLGLVESFRRQAVDAAFVVGPTESGTVWSLLFADGVRLMDVAQAEAYARRLSYLSTVVLPRGTVDLVRDLPPRDVTLLASVATVLVREDLHPALVDLLMQAAADTHGGAGIFQRPGQFPQAVAVDFPLAEAAQRYYRSGKPFLQRYLPFWAATLLDRALVMLVPVVALLLPLARFAPALYGWRIRSRIYRRYGELKFLEAEVEADPSRHSRDEWLARLEAIERDVNRLPTPLAFADMLYTFRSHIGLVREAVMRRTA